MRRPSLLAPLALAALTLAAGTASAAVPHAHKVGPKKLPRAHVFSWTDPAGDANVINDQGGVAPVDPGSVSTPVQVAGADIVRVSVSRVDDGFHTLGIRVAMTLAAAPMPNVLYRVTGAASNCSVFWFQYSSTVAGTPGGTLRHNCALPSGGATSAVGSTVSVPITTAVGGNTITWTLPVSAFPSGVTVGSLLTPALGETRALVGAAGVSTITAPVIDQTATQNTPYRIGQ